MTTMRMANGRARGAVSNRRKVMDSLHMAAVTTISILPTTNSRDSHLGPS